MLHIRSATPADVPVILRFIQELATYEREPDKVIATEADLLRDGFSLAPGGARLLTPIRFRCLIADWNDRSAGGDVSSESRTQPAGFALFFASYSTWAGHHGIRLEDLYVTPAKRGRGIGKALLAALAHIALEEGCPRLEWDVLSWNEAALAVYRRLGATTLEEWRIMRVSGEALHALASQCSPDAPSPLS